MKDNTQKPVSQSIFGSAPSAEMEMQRLQRQEMQRKRRRFVLIAAIPLVLILAGVVFAYEIHRRAEIKAYMQEMEAAEQAPPPRSVNMGYAGAKLQLEFVFPSEQATESPFGQVIYDAVCAKPSDIFVKYTLLASAEGKYDATQYGLVINGKKEYALRKADGTSTVVSTDLSAESAVIADVLNQLFADTYGKVRVPLAVKAPKAPAPPPEEEDSPLDDLQLPANSATRHN